VLFRKTPPVDTIHSQDFIRQTASEYLDAKGYQVVGESEVNGSLEELKALLDQFDEMKPDVLVVYNSRCLARSLSELCESAKLLEERGIPCDSVRDHHTMESIKLLKCLVNGYEQQRSHQMSDAQEKQVDSPKKGVGTMSM